MRNFKLIVLLLSFFLMVTACQLSSELKIDLGNPDEDFKNEKGNQVLVYKTKKYGISCERKFEVDTNSVVFTCGASCPASKALTYLISISFFFLCSGTILLCSGTILSQDIVKSPSLSSAPFTLTSSAIVNDLANCL